MPEDEYQTQGLLRADIFVNHLIYLKQVNHSPYLSMPEGYFSWPHGAGFGDGIRMGDSTGDGSSDRI
jgi:hypothetical protein